MPDDDMILFSESLLGEKEKEEDEKAEKEIENARGIEPEEKLLAIIEGVVEGTSLNRLVVTDEGVSFYQKGSGVSRFFRSPKVISMSYDEIDTIKGIKGRHEGEIDIATNESIIKFKDMAKDDVDPIISLILTRKEVKDRKKDLSRRYEGKKEKIREFIREKEVSVKVRCSYCEYIYDEVLNKCPNCGTPLHY